MIDLIKEHLRKYPKAELQDILKLIYQSEFGGGHLIQDSYQSLKRIEEEYAQYKPSSEKRKLWEPIGGGMCRIYLDALAEGLSAETLNKIFVVSANQKRGSVEGLEKKLRDLTAYCSADSLKGSEEQIACWKETGYPAISHSETYREAYQPAYRVAEAKYGIFLEAFIRIDRLLQSDRKSITVTIDGMCGGGKSTLGEALKQVYDCNLIHMDDFFLQSDQRTEKRLAEVGGNVDYERFYREVVCHLQDEQGFSYGIFDCGSLQITEKVFLPFKRLQVIEGSYSAHPYFDQKEDLRFFVETNVEEQKRRILERNGERMLKRFVEEWIPKEMAYFEKFGIRESSICLHT